MAGYKIVLSDQQRMFLEGVKTFLENYSTMQFSISATLTSGKDLIEYLNKVDVNIVFTEINFPGFEPEELIKEIKKAGQNTKLVILSAYGDINLVKSCFRMGADGYLLKSSDLDSLIACINTVVQGKIYIGENLKVAPELNNNIAENDLKKKRIPVDRFLIRQSMTRRELEILELICKGHSNKKIGEELFISEHTASVHRKHILKKIGAINSQELIEFVKEFEILK
jgi:DNA-binding NarL/FixJ family response regulator